jgi:hypothetical protein
VYKEAIGRGFLACLLVVALLFAATATVIYHRHDKTSARVCHFCHFAHLVLAQPVANLAINLPPIVVCQSQPKSVVSDVEPKYEHAPPRAPPTINPYRDV